MVHDISMKPGPNHMQVGLAMKVWVKGFTKVWESLHLSALAGGFRESLVEGHLYPPLDICLTY